MEPNIKYNGLFDLQAAFLCKIYRSYPKVIPLIP